eukprot:Rmarinus@m.497
MSLYAAERAVALEAVRKACRLCESVRQTLVAQADSLSKSDKSPVTVADFGAQAVVNLDIMRELKDPVVGEEDSADLRKPEGASLKEKVVQHVRSIVGDVEEDAVLGAIDYGCYEGGPKGRHWALDPIDGTKGFLRNDQYAVALGLIEDGKCVLGVLGCPNLPVEWSSQNGARGVIFVGIPGQGAMAYCVDSTEGIPVKVSTEADITKSQFVESVESGHSNHSDSAKIAEMLGVTNAPVRMDSQCKYAAVARGDAQMYLRLPTRKGYEEKIWDHAAGVAVITAAGGKVTDVRGNDLDFSIGRTLRDNLGVVASNGLYHDKVISAVRSVLNV